MIPPGVTKTSTLSDIFVPFISTDDPIETRVPYRYVFCSTMPSEVVTHDKDILYKDLSLPPGKRHGYRIVDTVFIDTDIDSLGRWQDRHFLWKGSVIFCSTVGRSGVPVTSCRVIGGEVTGLAGVAGMVASCVPVDGDND